MTKLAALLLALCAGLPAQTAPGVLLDVGGYRVHLYCTGAGTPTVMLIGAFSFDWTLVPPEIAQSTRVCSYDASGNAFSDPGPAPTCQSRVDEIHRMLREAHLDPPYLLTGFSVGALFARLYAKTYPDEVAGLVFIDHAFLPAKSAPPLVASGPDSPPAVIFAPPIEFGVEDEPGFNKLPPAVRELHRWAASRSPERPTVELAEQCLALVKDSKLGDRPLAVVSTANDTDGYSKLQRNLLALSNHSRQLIADKSFHSVEITQPEVVIDAIRTTLEAIRNDR